MSRSEVYLRVYESRMFSAWHWYAYHFAWFKETLSTVEHPFARSIVDAVIKCESRCPGLGTAILDRLASIGGRERDVGQREQLVQVLAELFVVQQIAGFAWPGAVTFRPEQSLARGAMKPELVIETEDYDLAVEVKAPAMRQYSRQRAENDRQVVSRMPKEVIEALTHGDPRITLPRDNPVKDFLISADAKFAAYGQTTSKRVIGLLVIVWDDFINEPISSLMSPLSGLFTSNSYFQPDGSAPKFENIDGVVVVRHLHQIDRASADQPLVDGCRHALDYGEPDQYPYKSFIANPNRRNDVPDVIRHALQAVEPDPPNQGAEYQVHEVIFWNDSLRTQPTAPPEPSDSDPIPGFTQFVLDQGGIPPSVIPPGRWLAAQHRQSGPAPE